VIIPVPWRNCRLVYGYTVVAKAIDGTGDMVCLIQLDAANGTQMASVTIPASSAVGAVTEFTITTESVCSNLGRDDTGRDAISIDVDGSTTGTGSANFYFYLEKSGS
jgi:hypothetical protein